MLVPYFKQGLEKKESCVWLVGDLTIEEARDALSAVVPASSATWQKDRCKSGITGTLYECERNSEAVRQLCGQFVEMGSIVKTKGFAGLRASGSASWVDNEKSMSRFMDYETKVNCAIQNYNIMAVCTSILLKPPLLPVQRAHSQSR